MLGHGRSDKTLFILIYYKNFILDTFKCIIDFNAVLSYLNWNLISWSRDIFYNKIIRKSSY